MTYESNNLVRPGAVTAIAIMALVSGIVNVVWGVVAAGSVLASIFLVCLVPFAALPTVLGVFEIIYAAKLLYNPPQPVQPSNTIAILEIATILFGNVFSMVAGILTLVFYNDPQVRDYFARLNGLAAPETAPEAPARPLIPEAAPDTAMDEAPAPESKPRRRKGTESPDPSE
ncbi:MAG: hypothetical protein AB1846_01535 [Chloroflexota bacterium]